jgi:hypothetical protein
VFLSGLGSINTGLIYSFFPTPSGINPNFLNLVDITKPHILFALLAGISQFFQLKYQPIIQEKPTNTNDMQGMMAYNMTKQMKYILPFQHPMNLIDHRFLQTQLIGQIYWPQTSWLGSPTKTGVNKLVRLSWATSQDMPQLLQLLYTLIPPSNA